MSSRLAVWPKNTNSARQSQQGAQKRPQLRLIKNTKAVDVSRVSPRARVLGLLGAVAVALFGIVAFHVNISQSQFAIVAMNKKANAEQERYERLRLEVSQLESPARISDYAQKNLGLVSPTHVKAIAPQLNDVAKGLPLGGANPSTPAGGDLGWGNLKPHLSASSS